MTDFYEDDEDPQVIRAAFDRGPHGFTSSGGARLACGNGGFIESDAELKRELARLTSENQTLREQVEDKGAAIDAIYRDAWAMINERQDDLYAAQDEIEKLKGERDRARDLAVRSGAFTSDYGPPALTRTDFLADQFCWAVVGSRPSWMSPDQYDPCNCRLPKGHDPVDGPGTLDGHCCGAHDDDHPAAIARFGGAS